MVSFRERETHVHVCVFDSEAVSFIGLFSYVVCIRPGMIYLSLSLARSHPLAVCVCVCVCVNACSYLCVCARARVCAFMTFESGISRSPLNIT